MDEYLNQKTIRQELQEGIKAFKNKDLVQAEKIFKRILKNNENEPNALHLLGCVYKEKNELQIAASLIQSSIQQDDRSPIPFLNLGKIYAMSGNMQYAAKAFQESLKRNQTNGEAWYCLANTLRQIGQAKEAINAYTQAIKQDPKHVNAANNLGALLHEQKETAKASKMYLQAIKHNPNDAGLRNNYGKLLADECNHEAAIAQYKHALQIEPDSYKLLYNYGNSLRDIREVELAIECYRKAVSLKPNHANSLGELARLLVDQRNFKDAIALFKNALKSDPSEISWKAGLGWALLKEGNMKEAMNYYSDAVRQNPTDTDSLFYLFRAANNNNQNITSEKTSYGEQMTQLILASIQANRIIAFGDSHVLLFNDINNFEAHNVGAATAHNLIVKNTTTSGREKIFKQLKKSDPAKDAVLLSFGEVDIRANIIKYCYRNSLSIKQCVEIVVSRYISFAKEIVDLGFQVLIYGGYGAGNDRNSYGTEKQRNAVAKSWNKTLEDASKNIGAIYFSLFDIFFNEKQCATDKWPLSDGFHLEHSSKDAKEEIQLLLLERIYKATKKAVDNKENEKEKKIILGNAGSKSTVSKGYLVNDTVVWEESHNRLYSITVDLEASLAIKDIDLEFEYHIDTLNYTCWLDGKKVSIRRSKELKTTWNIFNAKNNDLIFGRYLMLESSTVDLNSVKKIVVKLQPLDQDN